MGRTDHLDDRRKKLEAARELGFDPFGSSFPAANPIASVRALIESEGGEGSSVAVAGRIVALRDHGKSKFFDLLDRSGRVQAYLREKDLPDSFELVKLCEPGDIIGVEGTLGKTRMGEITVFATSFRLLSKSLRPLPEKWHGLKDVETRYRRRYLDLIANRESTEVFLKRSAIIREFRSFMDSLGFMEVETPMMQPIPGGAAARPFVTHHNTLDIDLYLRIAPELFLKRLLVGGLDKVYELGRMFRNEGISTRHNPEFTMVEIYQAYSDRDGMMQLCEDVVSQLCMKVNGGYRLSFGGHELDLTPPWRRVTYLDLLRENAGVDPWDREAVANALRQRGVAEPPADHDHAMQELFELTCESGMVQPTFVLDHPASLTPLCRPRTDDPRLSERFELFIAGFEFANAYTELNDPDLQRRFFTEQLKRGSEESIGRIDEDFLLALEYGMPPAGGMGIGIDRLVMLLCSRTSIRDVVLFPLLRPRLTTPDSEEDELATEEDGEN